MIYFIRAGENGPVKIGKADDVAARLASLQTSHYEPLTLIRKIAGSHPEETWLRKHYKAQRIRGEWHQFCPTMLTIEPPAGLASAPRESVTQAALLAEILAFLARSGMAETKFGIAAVNDGKLVSRLRAGKNMTVRTLDRAEQYLTAERAKLFRRKAA